VKEALHIPPILIPRIDMSPLTRRTAMSSEVETIGSIALRGQTIHDIHVSAAVFSKSMNDSQDGPGLFLCPPGLAIEIEPAGPLEGTFLMFHRSS
jgi:hypothetical protein